MHDKIIQKPLICTVMPLSFCSEQYRDKKLVPVLASHSYGNRESVRSDCTSRLASDRVYVGR